MRIRRKKFTIYFTISMLSFFILLYMWINYALPQANRPVEITATEQRHVADRQQVVGDGGNDKGGIDNRGHAEHIDTQDLIKDSIINAEKWSEDTADTGHECSIRGDVVPSPDIQMLDVYRELAFDNPDGGVWKQGWAIEYDPKHWNSHHKLEVFIVPHSHNDPGWLKTFDQYYEHDTKSILANMLRHLDENEDMRFIWAEISYFSRWYESLAESAQRKVRLFVQRKQLEFVTGGWVMNDEANAHWLSVLQQLTEGQTWLQRHLNVTPTSHWSIDPFGYSPTQAYLIKEIGIRNMLIQRAHYSIKKRFAQSKTLEFNWRQLWDVKGDTAIFTHLMPFYSYDVPHTCGPDPKVCCQFDFKRLPGYGVSCPWRVAPQPITEQNVAARAALIVDQWRKKSVLYQTRSVLIPLGDDFRYSQSTEWVAQMTNFRKLFEYVNSEPSINVHVRFATLQDYFDGVAREKRFDEFPSFSGDFFTYADKDDNYWSGYYTSRPYHKRLDRVLMGYLRSAEMIHSWSTWDRESGLDKMLENGRRALSLFQHHDGVTGTAKDFVVKDYERIMTEALGELKFVIQQAAYRLLTKDTVYEPDYSFEYFNVDDFRSPTPDETRPTIIIGEEMPTKHIVLHNSLPYERDELVNFYIARPFAMVLDANGMPVTCQFDPVWKWQKSDGGTTASGYIPYASTTKFRISFRARVPPLGLRVYTLQATKSADASHLAAYARITVHTDNHLAATMQLDAKYPEPIDFVAPREISLRDEYTGQGASFAKNGLLKSISMGANTPSVPAHLEFRKYGVTNGAEHSGAYLFMPDGPAKSLLDTTTPTTDSVVLVSRGPLESSVATSFGFGVHQVLLRDYGLEIQNVVDIVDYANSEIVMRINTNIESDFFYTDLNGLQLIKRQRFDKLPIQANYYPVPSTMFIENDNHRLTLLSGQALGGSSLKPGQLEIMQDRRLTSDDNRGMGQGVLDNRPTLHVFKLLLESRESCTKRDASHPSGFLTLAAHLESQSLAHPMERLVFQGNEWPGMRPSFGDSREGVVGVDVAVLRNLPHIKTRQSQSATGLVLHRSEFEKCPTNLEATASVNVRKLLDMDEAREMYESTLTMLKKRDLLVADSVPVCPMGTKAIILPNV